MANENQDITNNSGEHKPEEHKHTSFLKHIVDEIKEEIDELVEEAQTTMNDGGFSALGNGHINVVHDHHHHEDEEKSDENKEDKKEG